MTKEDYYKCPKCHSELRCDVKAKQGGRMPPTFSYTCPDCGFHKYMFCYADFCAEMEKYDETRTR